MAGEAADDRGLAALELVILAPVMLLLIGFMIAAGRTSIAQGAIDAAARAAARQASVAQNLGAAQLAAYDGARTALHGDGLNCQPIVTLPGVRGAFGSQVGQSVEIHAFVVCKVRLSDLVIPGIPGSIRLTASFSSPLDPFRSRDLGNG
jgi:hypothetical protein